MILWEWELETVDGLSVGAGGVWNSGLENDLKKMGGIYVTVIIFMSSPSL
jgi:hypothetical protein